MGDEANFGGNVMYEVVGDKLYKNGEELRGVQADGRMHVFKRLDFENPSGIIPTAFKVLVKPDPPEEKSKGGIILIDDTKERAKFAGQKATLIAVSPAAFTYDDGIKADPPRPGARVVIAKFAGFDIKGEDGCEYRIIEDKDVVAVLA